MKNIIQIILVIALVFSFTGCNKVAVDYGNELNEPTASLVETEIKELQLASDSIKNFYKKDGFTISKTSQEDVSIESTTVRKDGIEMVFPTDVEYMFIFKNGIQHVYNLSTGDIKPTEDTESKIIPILDKYAGLLSDLSKEDLVISKYSIDDEDRTLVKYVVETNDSKEIFSKYFVPLDEWAQVPLHIEVIMDQSDIVELYLNINNDTVKTAIMFSTEVNSAFEYVGYDPTQVLSFI